MQLSFTKKHDTRYFGLLGALAYLKSYFLELFTLGKLEVRVTLRLRKLYHLNLPLLRMKEVQLTLTV